MTETLARELLNALNAMLVGTDTTTPEAFAGNTRAYLEMVAIPRAKVAVKRAQKDGVD